MIKIVRYYSVGNYFTFYFDKCWLFVKITIIIKMKLDIIFQQIRKEILNCYLNLVGVCKVLLT